MKTKYIAIASIIAGTALGYWGYTVYDSAGSQITRAIDGSFPIEALIGFVGGALLIGFGIYKLK